MSRRHSFRPALAFAAILLTTSGASGADPPPELPPEPTLDDFLRVAEARSPDLEASRRLWQAEIAAVDAAGSFPDPRASYAWFAEEVETRVGPQQHRLSLHQRLPWFGKLGLQREAAAESAEATRASHDERRLELRRDVTLAWYELYWLVRSTELTRENLDLLVNLERVIRERYRIGRAAHADLIRVQVELGVVENQLRGLEDRRRPVTARMNALLHRAADAPVSDPTQLAPLPSAPSIEGVWERIRAGSPKLRIEERRVAQADALKGLAARGRWPDWTAGVDWIATGEALDPQLDESGKDPIVVSVSVDLPLFRGKWDAPLRAAEERVALAHARRDREEDRLVARAEDVLFAWRDADRRLALYRGALIPKAQESYEALDTAYRTGQGAFLDLIEAQRTLLAFELEGERALADRGRSAARLDHLMGVGAGGEGSDE